MPNLQNNSTPTQPIKHNPKRLMYGIFTYMYPLNYPTVGK